jgi:HSP90 family molecular chaperone
MADAGKHKDALLSLLLFPSSQHVAQLTTLHAYVERMPAEQTEIFYLTGE